MKTGFNKTLISAALAFAVIPGAATSADLKSWVVNYGDSQAELGYGDATEATSRLTDEYKYTAESLVMFNDNDGSGGISAGDTFDDYIGFIIDGLNFGGVNTFDPDYQNGRAQITGVIKASGIQLDPINYRVTSAEIVFYYDSPTNAAGTAGNYANFNTLVDGLEVQTGSGDGVGTNSPLIPDGNIDIFFDLDDVLSSYNDEYDPFEIFRPFADLDKITFSTDSNNQLCAGQPGGGANCGGSIAGIAGFFGINPNDYDFGFHTRSDGSAVKVPEPATLALMGIGLIGAGFARKRSKKS